MCQRFKGVTASSPENQIKTFLRLRNDVPDEAWALLRENGKGPQPYEVRFQKANVKTRARLYRPVVLNPLLELTPLLAYRNRGSVARVCHFHYLHIERESVVMSFPESHFGNHSSFLRTYITDSPRYVANAELDASFRSVEKSSWGSVRVGDNTSGQGLKIGDVVLPRTSAEVYQEWDDELEVDYHTCANSQLEETMHNTGLVLTENDSDPLLSLRLSGVVIPTDEEWRVVSSQPVEARGLLLRNNAPRVI